MENNVSIIIDWLMKGATTVIGVVVGYYIAKDKYIFQKTYDRKMALIIDLYQQIARLEFELKKHVHSIGAETSQESVDKKIDKRRESLNKIKADFQRFQHKFWEVEIILDESTIEKIRSFSNEYIAITSKMTVSNILQQQRGYADQSFDDWDQIFTMVSSGLAEIKNDLKKEFRKTLKK